MECNNQYVGITRKILSCLPTLPTIRDRQLVATSEVIS